MKEKGNLNVSGVYKILCLVNGKLYIGSSKNIRMRWSEHWNERERAKTKNQMMYDDMRKYGKENFRIYVIYEGDDYKRIEKVVTYNLQPEYNIRNKTGKVKKVKRFASNTEYHRYYYHTESGKEACKRAVKKYTSQPCLYNGEILTLWALRGKLERAGVEHPVQEAKKYLIQESTTQMYCYFLEKKDDIIIKKQGKSSKGYNRVSVK